MKPLFTLLLCVFAFTINAQTLTYEAFLKGHKVGELVVVKEVSDNKTSIHSSTNLEVHMLFKLKVQITSHSIYLDGVLVESEANSKQNGHLHSSVIINQIDDGYNIDIDGTESTISDKGIIAADELYFEEPKDISHTIALATGQYLEIQKGENGEYFFVHDGKKESHRYKNGVLEQVIINHKLYTVTMILKEE